MTRCRAFPLLALVLAACGRAPVAQAPAARAAPSPRAAALLAALPPAYRGADLENGRLHFTLCRSCHVALAGGADMTGPNLYGVFGRRAGSRPGFPYSAELKATGWTWDAPRLDVWLTAPAAAVPGTRMSFPGIRDDADRRDVIAYLKVVSSGAQP